MAPSGKAAKAAQEDPTPEAEAAQPAEEESTSEARDVQYEKYLSLVSEVLGGRYGDHDAARNRLTEEGYDASAVLAGVNQRIAGGAPHAYKPTGVNLIQQIRDGEWGDAKGLEQRLSAAGFSQPAVSEALSKLNKE